MRSGSAPVDPRGEPVADAVAAPQHLRFPGWLWALAFAVLALGMVGFTGSSSWAESSGDRLLDPAVRSRHPELLGRSRAIRADEFSVELPSVRAQQLAIPSFPLVNLNEGLGQLQRNAYMVPVLDWGLAFRPLTWPLVVGTRGSYGVRWYLRTAVLVLGLFAWFRILSLRRGSDAEARHDDAVAGLCAAAVLCSSAFSWWMSTSLPEALGFAGLALAATDRGRTAVARTARAGWLGIAGWLFACAFFAFYAPLWGPTLWIVCGAVFDLHWRATRSARAALRASWPVFLVLAAGVVVALFYFAPYVALVRDTVYPGHRPVGSGDFIASRFLDVFWPSLEQLAPMRRGEGYLGRFAWMNVCEASAVEVLPLAVLVALAAVEGPVRAAARRALGGAPGTSVASVLFLAWMLLPFPPWLAAISLLRWSPTARVFFTFGFALALLAGSVLLQMRPEAASRPRWRDMALASAALLATGLAARQLVVARLSPRDAVQHALPAVLFVVLLLAAVRRCRGPSAPVLMGIAWALPVVVANLFVNPVIRSRDLVREGSGHAAVVAAVQSVPGRILHYRTHSGTYLNAFGWPMLAGVEQAPDVALFRYLSNEVPGLTAEVYNRYAHVFAVLPPTPTRLLSPDSFAIALSPCSARLATLDVNHFLVAPDAKLPDACREAFRVTPVRDLVLWTRIDPVGEVGIARTPRPETALEFDFRVSAVPPGARVTRSRDALDVTVPPRSRPIAFPVNLSVIDRVRCTGATVRALDAHLVFEAATAEPGHCRAEFLGTVGAVRRLVNGSRAYPVMDR